MPRRILLAGLGIEAIYLAAVLGPFSLLANGTELTDLGKLTNHQPIPAILVTIGIIALFVFYGLAMGSLPKVKPHNLLRLVFGLTALQSLTLVFLYPIMATDLYIYAVHAYAAAFYHLNVLVAPPIAAGGDPFFDYARDWAQLPSPYGPLWVTLSTLVALVAGSNIVVSIVLLKLLGAVATLGTTALLVVAVGDRGPRAQVFAALLFGWNPLVQLELVGNGHNDAVMTLFLVAGLLFLRKKRSALGMVAVGGALLIKILPIDAVPLCLLATLLGSGESPWRRLTRLVTSAAALVGIMAVAYAPFWVGLSTIQRIQQADRDFLASIPALIVAYVPDGVNWLIYPRLAFGAAITLWLAYAMLTRRLPLEIAVFEALFATILLSTHFSGWYLALLVALSALTMDHTRQLRIVVFTLTAMLTTPIWTYLWIWLDGWVITPQFLAFVIPFTFVPPLLLTFPASAQFVERLVKRMSYGSRKIPAEPLRVGVTNEYPPRLPSTSV